MIAIAVFGGLLFIHIHGVTKQRRAVQAVLAVGGAVYYDYELDENSNRLVDSFSPWPRWLIVLLGVDSFATIEGVRLHFDKPVTDAAICQAFNRIGTLHGLRKLDLFRVTLTETEAFQLARLKDLEDLSLHSCAIKDSALPCLDGLSKLGQLNLGYTGIGNAGLRHVRSLENVYSLNLTGTNITDAGLLYLLDLGKLCDLDLSKTNVTDAGLVKLSKLPSLEWLSLNHCVHVTDEGVLRLKKSLPTLRVSR